MITESQMAVKLLYSLDSDNTTKFVAKPPAPFRVSVHADFGIGFCRLDKCLDYMVSNCSEFSAGDFTVFSADFSEENAPLLSHGRLTHLTKSVETVSGKIKQNLLNQQIFEVQLYFKRFDDPHSAPKTAVPQRSLAVEPSRRLPPSSPPAAKRHRTTPDLASKEFISNSFNPLDASMMMQAYFPRKRMHKEEPVGPSHINRKVPRCDNCKTFETTVWRWGPDYEVLCNPCGLWPRTHNGKMRPEKFWIKKKEKQPERWRPHLTRHNPAEDAFALHELTESEIREARTDTPTDMGSEMGSDITLGMPLAPPPLPVPMSAREHPSRESSYSSPRALSDGPSTPISQPVDLPSTPVASRQNTEQDKENIPPPAQQEVPSTPPRGQPLEIVGNDSHHKWMQRFIQGNNDEHDLFEAFMRSPSKHPTRQIDFEITSALSSSPPSSSSNVFDVSEQDLASIGTEWIFRTPEKAPPGSGISTAL